MMQSKSAFEMVTIRLFGNLEAIRGDEEPIRRFRSRTAAEVLALLSVSIPRILPRDEVAAIVWPEDETEQARQSLRTAISSLRKQLGVEGCEDLFTGDRHSVGLDAGRVGTDYDRFHRLVALMPPRKEHLRDAVGLVRGPLLQGIDASWTIPHQLAFEETYSRTVIRLMEVLSADDSASLAIDIGRSALRICPMREDIHIALIRTLGIAGMNAEAIRQYEVLEQLLMDQWGEYPSDEAVEAIESLGRRPTRRPLRPPPGDEATALRSRQGWVFGREREVGEVLMALQDEGPTAHRLITLVGAGGSGKTTIARVVQESLADVVPVAFADLAPIGDIDRAVGACARALGLPNPDGPDTADRVRLHLAGERSILILDNAEHLAGIGGTVADWLEVPGSGRILATSRVALGIRGERLYGVPTLPLPSRKANIGELAENPCVRLFLDRAAAADPEFELGLHNAKAVAEICIALDGVPLAIELAAAQVLVMSPAQILKKLGEERFRLAAPSGDPDDRHASLDRVARSSYDLLETEHRVAFRRLGIFRGSFSIEAAEAVAGVPDIAAALARLVRCSLLERHSGDEAVRFRMLVPLRAFALDRLREAGEEDEVRLRHRDHFEAVALKLRKAANTADPSPAFREFEREHDHFRQIIDHAQAKRIWAGPVMRLAFAIGSIVVSGSYQFEWRDRMLAFMEWAANAEEATELDRAMGYFALGQFAGYALRGDIAMASIEEAVQGFERSGRPVDVAGALNLLGLACIFPNPAGTMHADRGEAALARATAILDDATEDSLWSVAQLGVAVRANLAANYRVEQRHAEAIVLLEQALEGAKRHGIVRFLPSILTALSNNSSESGDAIAGERYALQAIEASRALGLSAATPYFALAIALTGQGRHLESIRILLAEEFCAHVKEDADIPGLTFFCLAIGAHHLGNFSLRSRAHLVAQRLGYIGHFGPAEMIPDPLLDLSIHIADLRWGDEEPQQVLRAFREAFAEPLPADLSADGAGA
jgi:predicted ATPase/DNA-binding SARP family transcriptional activator